MTLVGFFLFCLSIPFRFLQIQPIRKLFGEPEPSVGNVALQHFLDETNDVAADLMIAGEAMPELDAVLARDLKLLRIPLAAGAIDRMPR